MTGTICHLNVRGYGFILRPGAKTADVFFHINSVVNRMTHQPAIHSRVRYTLTQTARGPEAIAVEVIEQ